MGKVKRLPKKKSDSVHESNLALRGFWCIKWTPLIEA